MKNIFVIAIAACLYLLSGCKTKDNSTPSGNITITNESVVLNPNGDAPLSAIISFTTSLPTKISIRVVGKNGSVSDVIHDFNNVSNSQSIPVLGLYPDFNNSVEVSIKNSSGNVLITKTYSIKTSPLPADIFPLITINTKQPGTAAGMTLVSYYGNNASGVSPQFPFIFDEFGDVRWYYDFRNNSVLNSLFYDDGIERLQNGDFYFGDISSNTIYEMDMQGKIINTWPIPGGYLFHHNVQEKPNGNFLVTVSQQGAATAEDKIIELDRNTKEIVRTWDLMKSLQYSRQTLTTDLVDWIHVNAVIYDATDSSIIISGRTQALVKLDQNNNVIWILGNHKGWGLSGNGVDLNNYLLQPLDKNNVAITDTNILNGVSNSPDFEWNWYQHAPLIMPNGDITLFDNGGDNRNFTGSGEYSRAVEYSINKTDKTVKQVWEYGKSRGNETFSHIVSDVDFLPDYNHLIFSPGAVSNATQYGKVIELDYKTQNVLFEATITPPIAYFTITFHRTERLSLYP